MLVISQIVGTGVGTRTFDGTAHLGKFHRGEGRKKNNENPVPLSFFAPQPHRNLKQKFDIKNHIPETIHSLNFVIRQHHRDLNHIVNSIVQQ